MTLPRAVKAPKFKPGQIVRDKRTPRAIRAEETAEMFVFVAVNPLTNTPAEQSLSARRASIAATRTLEHKFTHVWRILAS